MANPTPLPTPLIDYATPPNNPRARDRVITTLTILTVIFCAAVWLTPLGRLVYILPLRAMMIISITLRYGIPWLTVLVAIRLLRSRRAALRLPVIAFLTAILATLASVFFGSYILFGKFDVAIQILPGILYLGFYHLLGFLPCQFLAYIKKESQPPI